jgi:hypothetical protein
MTRKASGGTPRRRKRGRNGSASVAKPNWAAEVARAEREMERNKRRILAGETFAGGRRARP